jgi:hypothetical protein
MTFKRRTEESMSDYFLRIEKTLDSWIELDVLQSILDLRYTKETIWVSLDVNHPCMLRTLLWISENLSDTVIEVGPVEKLPKIHFDNLVDYEAHLRQRKVSFLQSSL